VEDQISAESGHARVVTTFTLSDFARPLTPNGGFQSALDLKHNLEWSVEPQHQHRCVARR
jgi:hypothetical protein